MILSETQKSEIASVTAREVERIDRYVSAKEARQAIAQPSDPFTDADKVCPETEALKRQLGNLESGLQHATLYQKLILEILNLLFEPELIDGELEVRTIDSTERRDIIFTNDSDKSFWDYLRNEHAALLMMFETKNTEAIEPSHINQTATYLGDRIGRIGFIVTRNPPQEAQIRKLYSVYNDSTPRKIILILSDADIGQMLDMKCRGQDPMRLLQRRYREFRTKAQ